MIYPFKVYPAINAEGPFWIAESLSLNGCAAQGATINKAIMQLNENEIGWLNTHAQLGFAAPKIPVLDLTSPVVGSTEEVDAPITVYTDGSCLKNPGGPGGWGVIIKVPGYDNIERSGGAPTTTNNRMEMTAAIEGLKETHIGCKVLVTSDSQYVVGTMTEGWKRNRNQDLWAILDALVKERIVTFQWVRSHNGHPENERCDELAGLAANKFR